MIGKLTGIVDMIGEGEIILDVQGVGYLLSAGARTLRATETGATMALQVETVFKQDQLKLYGFANERERAWFVRLQDIQGVGPKAALAILDVLDPDALMQAALLEDKASIARAQGVGPKLASRIALELKNKPEPTGRGGVAFAANTAAPSAGAPVQAGSEAAEAVSALVNLGFAQTDAAAAVRTARGKLDEDTPSVQTLIRAGLKELNR